MPDSPFVHLSGTTYVSPGPTNIGVIDAVSGVVLIDSGNDKDSGRKLNKALREWGREPRVVVNTHSNADHIGANAYLQQNAGCQIWAPAVEAAFIETPLLESSFLWGGYPFKALRSKFFQAKSSKPDRLIDENCKTEGLRFIPLPGHFINQYGVLTLDGVFFLGDSLFGETVIDKYGLPFIYDLESFRNSIERIKTIEAEYFVPSHGDVTRDISRTADLNLKTLDDAEADILRILNKSMPFEELLKIFCDDRKILLNYGQYVLIGSTIRSFLSYLSDNRKAEYYFSENQMIWKAVK